MVDLDLQRQWRELIEGLEQRFGNGLDLDGVLFLIGVQELGQGHRSFSKQQKMDLIHVAVCRLLSQYGYYRYEGMDPDGWPHYRALAKLPKLNAKQQSLLIKEAVIDYFRRSEMLD